MYLITNEGLKVLEEKGIKKILDDSFKSLDDYMLSSFPFDEDIKEYGAEHHLPNLLEKINEDEKKNIPKEDSFIVRSGIIPNLLKKKLPKKLTSEIKDAISAYYIYWNRFLNKGFYRGHYLWRDDNFLNIVRGDTNGDMYLNQYTLKSFDSTLIEENPLLIKASSYGVNGYYTEWIRMLPDFFSFCLQIGKPVPFKDDWEETFYHGHFEDTKAGEVASYLIERLQAAKERKEYSSIQVLPFIDDPMKHINLDKKIHYVHSVKSVSGFESMPFIDKESLVYLHKSKTGVEFIHETWGDLGVRFYYDQIHHAIRGIVSCIQNHGSRCMPHDPCLVFKYFPYERYEEIFDKL